MLDDRFVGKMILDTSSDGHADVQNHAMETLGKA